MKVIVALASLLAMLSFTTQAQQHATAPGRGTSAPALKVEIVSPPGAPLRVTEVITRWAVPDQTLLELSVKVENAGSRATRAYATRDGADATGAQGQCHIDNAKGPGKVLQPGHSILRTSWRSYTASSLPAILYVSVDFVELVDDKTWGADRCGVAEHLAGARAGGSGQIERLQKILKQTGPQAVMNIVGNYKCEAEAPAGQSERWTEAFRAGAETICARVRQAVQEWGLDEIEAALKRPFDASGAQK